MTPAASWVRLLHDLRRHHRRRTDDGTYGYDLTCAEFSFDDGDCDGSSGGGSDGGSGGIGDSCGTGRSTTAPDCVSETTVSYYTGDGTCDDGTWGYDLECADSPTTTATVTEAAAAERQRRHR